MLLGYLSFDMISDAMIRHAGADNLELVKQITKNIETVMTGFDDISNEILTNENFDRLVKCMLHWMMNIKGSKQKKHREYTKRLYQHENGHSGHSSGYKYRRIHYLGRTRPLVTDNALSYYVVKDSSKAEETHCGLTRIRLRLHPREHIQGTSWSYPT